MKTIGKLYLIGLMMGSAIVCADEKPSKDIVLDLSASNANQTIQYDENTTLNISLMSMAPSKLDSYRFIESELFVTPKTGLIDSRKKAEGTVSENKAEINDKQQEIQSEKSTLQNGLNTYKQIESQLSTKGLGSLNTQEIAQLRELQQMKYRLDILVQEENNLQIREQCTQIADYILNNASETDIPHLLKSLKSFSDNDKCETLYQEVLNVTKKTITRELTEDVVYDLEVGFGSETLGSFTAEPRDEWITHVGFAFIENKDKRYFSKEVQINNENMDPMDSTNTDSMTEYAVTAVSPRKKYEYAALGMYTYPFHNITNDRHWQLGATAGLGTDSSNLVIGAGISVIVYRNLMISLMLVGTEFDVLKGKYESGQNIGNNQIESDDFVEQTFKFAPAITLSLKFDS